MYFEFVEFFLKKCDNHVIVTLINKYLQSFDSYLFCQSARRSTAQYSYGARVRILFSFFFCSCSCCCCDVEIISPYKIIRILISLIFTPSFQSMCSRRRDREIPTTVFYNVVLIHDDRLTYRHSSLKIMLLFVLSLGHSQVWYTYDKINKSTFLISLLYVIQQYFKSR